jgi:Zn-dependent protease with chaperone function
LSAVLAALEHFLVFGTLLAVPTLATAGAVRLVVGHRAGWSSPHARARIYAGAIVVPPVVAAWLVAATLTPEWWLDAATFDAAHVSVAHERHLLATVFAPWEPTPALLSCAFLLAVVTLIGASIVRGALRVRRVFAQLAGTDIPPSPAHVRRLEAWARRHDLAIGVILTPYPVSFVWGFRRAKLVVSSGLLRTLNSAALRAVVEHEGAHQVRRDNVLRLILSMASYGTLLAPLARRVLRWWAEEIELTCDAVAAASTRDPLTLASALLQVRRGMSVVPRTLGVGFVPDEARVLERRVEHLLALADALPGAGAISAMRRGPCSPAVALGLVFVVTLAGAIALSPLAIHRAAEALLLFGG